ncbi:cytochrome c3 family protein [Aquimarina mytili]|uniref:Cytochrome c3 family protein n=1 Tax=Aquimarina mytili TaxID=874423 RepID=A0A936ZPX7_9FLAO|nr:cytochrome c3 family protein [Aquimarina mytili]MBL0682147.1 cytochrome c3 family protein [Aquimarina mytili]
MRKRLILIVPILLIIIGASIFFLIKSEENAATYVPITPIAQHRNGMEFFDSAICIECHKQIVEDHLKTAHYNSLQPANANTIKGSFENDKNSFKLNEKVVFNMVAKDSGFYQEPVINTQKTPFYSAKMDLVVGSGTKGQSYLMWNNNSLFQLQASYFTPTNSWINSPGAPDQLAPARPVIERCLECHTTYAQNISGSKKGNQFHRKNIAYGIDCQRCHDTVTDHVKYHQQNPEENTARHILKYSSLSRQQRLDACALCHSGLRTKTTERAFTFMTGDSLENFSFPDYDESSLEELDVHGNQYGLLKASTCFKKSEVLDCSSCHNPHKKERGQLSLFNQKCMNCHASLNNPTTCTGDKVKTQQMSNNCVQCHMPLVDSKSMKIQVKEDEEVAVKVRTHLIGIYNNQNLE